jgi:general secretion pathway protein D
LENSDIQSRDPVLGVTTTQRKLKSEKIVARDGLPVVLGGLMQEVERETTNQVPGLGSIPILGWLFKSKQKQRTKVNLLMILVPHVLESPDDVRRIHKRRMEERFEFLERYTAFKRRDLSINVNYRKKAGLLSALNEEATRLSDEAKFRQQAEAELEQQEITGEIGLSPKMDDEEEAEEPKAKAAVEPASSGTRPPRRAQ